MRLGIFLVCIISCPAFASDCGPIIDRVKSVGAAIDAGDHDTTFMASFIDDVRIGFSCYKPFVLMTFEAEAHQPAPKFFREVAGIAEAIDGGPPMEINDALAACAGIAATRVPASRVKVPFSRGEVQCLVESGPLSNFDIKIVR